MYDVIIIGAGPSGSLAALLLARKNRRVLLLDRATFPRAKVCGDCLNPRIRPLLEKLDLWSELQLLPQHVLQGIQLEQDGVSVFQHSFTGNSFRAIARSVLDDWLMKKAVAAGAEVRLKTTVTGVDYESGIVTTDQGTFTGQLILGADGRNSSTARCVGLSPEASVCQRVGWQTTLSLPGLDADVHMNVFRGGYYGLVKINAEEANLCLVLDAQSSWKPTQIVNRYFPQAGELEWRSVHPIKRKPATTVKQRVWLLGDAARVVEPFTGEGIFFALASAQCAVDLITGETNPIDPASLSTRYALAHQQLYRDELTINHLTRWLLEKSSRGYRALPWLKRFPALLHYATGRVVF